MDVSMRVIGDVLVMGHTSRPIPDEEWDTVLATSRRLLEAHAVVRVLVDAPGNGGGPSIPQRQRLNGLPGIERMRTAVCTDSRVVLGIVTAVSWFMGRRVRAFRSSDLAGAFTHLAVTLGDEAPIRAALAKVRADVLTPSVASSASRM